MHPCISRIDDEVCPRSDLGRGNRCRRGPKASDLPVVLTRSKHLSVFRAYCEREDEKPRVSPAVSRSPFQCMRALNVVLLTVTGHLVSRTWDRYSGASQGGIAPHNPNKQNQDALVMAMDRVTSSIFLAVLDGHGQAGRRVSQVRFESPQGHGTVLGMRRHDKKKKERLRRRIRMHDSRAPRPPVGRGWWQAWALRMIVAVRRRTRAVRLHCPGGGERRF